MINRRAPRPSRAVENLQQFCLNNSAGIDCTAPHNNVKNIYDSTNLVPNPDGSLSLRKPLLIKHDWTRLVKQKFGDAFYNISAVPLYLDNTYLVLFENDSHKYFAIYENQFIEQCTLAWTDAENNSHSKKLLGSSYVIYDKFIAEQRLVDLSTAKVFHSTTTTVIGNCTVCLNSEVLSVSSNDVITKYPMVDKSLYPNEGALIYKPRFIRVFRGYSNEWTFDIHNPNTNVFEINPDTKTYEHPLNTSFDDMYNLQDTYNAAVPYVKQIVPYVYTVRKGTSVVPVKTTETTTTTGTTVQRSLTFKETKSDVLEVENPHPMELSAQRYEKNVEKTLFKFTNEVCTGSVIIKGNAEYSPFGSPIKYLMSTTSKCVLKIKPLVPIDSLNISFTGDATVVLRSTVNNVTSPSYSSLISSVNQTIQLKEETEYTIVRGLPFNEQSMLWAAVAFNISCTLQCTAYWTVSDKITVQDSPSVNVITNTVANDKYRGVSIFPYDISQSVTSVYLKAFCNFPKPLTGLKYYATWLYTLDGVSWLSAIAPKPVSSEDTVVNVYENTIEIATDELPIESVDTGIDSDKLPKKHSTSIIYAPLYNDSGTPVLKRIDLLKVSEKSNPSLNILTNVSFRFKIVLVDGDGSEQNPYKIVGTYGQADYVPVLSQKGEYWYSDFGNSVLGEKLYYKSRIFSFGDSSFKNNIFVSEPGEFILPFKNTIDISASEDSVVTSITPWKDYLFVSTPQALYLISQVDSGWLTKTANAALGVSQTDAMCVVAALNSIIFKSGSKIYMFYPNIYAGDDSVINVTDISSPIEHLLEGFDSVSGAFAFGTNSEYVLMLPKPQGTLCLSYDYTTRVWTKTEYPVRFTKHIVNSLTDVVLFGQNPEDAFCEYHYNKSFVEAYGKDVGAPYGDVLVESENGILNDIETYGSDNSTLVVTPIRFGLDTGQKAEAIVTTKQFVETKFVLATLDKADAFPMQLTVHIDGDPHIITRDISTDAAFWKDSSAKGVLNTTFSGLSDKSDTFNVLRQLIVRYSGKGKSIRHILEGQSLSNFKLYETYIRYKLLNVKQ